MFREELPHYEGIPLFTMAEIGFFTLLYCQTLNDFKVFNI